MIDNFVIFEENLFFLEFLPIRHIGLLLVNQIYNSGNHFGDE